MLRHSESTSHLGRFDPDWVRAHERLIAQQRLRSDIEVESAPWWAFVFSNTPRTTRLDTEQ
jgi:hypothetical protein